MFSIDLRTKSLINNIGWTALLRVGATASSLISIPVLINLLGTNEYGIWITLSSLLAWINFFDLGTTLSLQNSIAQTVAKNQLKETKILVSSTYALITSLVIILFIIATALFFFINWNQLLNTNALTNVTLRNIVITITASISIQLILKLSTAVLFAHQKTYQIEIINLSIQILTLVFLLAIKNYAIVNKSLVTIALLTAIIPIIVYLTCNIYLFGLKYRSICPNLKFIKKNAFNSIIHNSGNFLILQLYGFVLFQTDNIVASYLFGPQTVTNLSLVSKYFSIITIFFGMIFLPYWSSVSEAMASRDFLWIQKIIKKNLVLIFVASIASMIMIPFTNDVICIWTRQKIKIPRELSFYTALYTIILAYNNIFGIILNAANLFKVQVYSAIIIILINVPIAFLLIKKFNYGISGILIANIICVSFFGIAITLQAMKVLRKKSNAL